MLLALLAGCSARERPHLLLVVVDTLRKDHLGTYGYERATSPTIDALAETGLVFEHHLAHASQTVPSTISLLSALLPAEHGFVHRELGQFMRRRPVFPAGLLRLPEILQRAGYATAGFVSNPFLGPGSGFDRGLETFQHWPGDAPGEAEVIAAAAARWLADQAGSGRPLFLYLHFMDVHQPYDQPEPWRSRFAPPDAPDLEGYGRDQAPSEAQLARAVALYDAGIAYVDHQLGEILASYRSLGLGDDLLVVITADHGEEFLEHGGIGHATTVYGELVRVPLVISLPEWRRRELRLRSGGRRLRHLSQHADLAPTLLDLLDVPRPAGFGRGTLLTPAPQVFAENGSWRAVYAGDHKLVVNLETGARALYRLDDELDARPLRAPAREGRLQPLLDRYVSLSRPPPAAHEAPAWTREERERLRALGYAE